MTTILQIDKDDLQEIVKEVVREALSEVQTPMPEPSDRIDKNEVKRMTGQGDSWVYKKTYKGCPDPLPYQKFGKRLVFSRKAIQEYIDAHTKTMASADEIMSDRLAESAKKRLR